MTFRKVLVAAIAAVTAVAAPRTGHAQTPIRFSGALGLALPVGDLGNAADVGFNLAFRGEGKMGSPDWGLRGDLTFDHLGGKGFDGSYSYFGLAGNVVHRTPGNGVYEFGGLGLYDFHVAVANASNDDQNLGLQLGVGVDLTHGPNSMFLEFGLVNVFTSGSNSLWFPVRFGIRF